MWIVDSYVNDCKVTPFCAAFARSLTAVNLIHFRDLVSQCIQDNVTSNLTQKLNTAGY